MAGSAGAMTLEMALDEELGKSLVDNVPYRVTT